MGSKATSLTLMQRALLIISAAAVYAVNVWPSMQVTNAGLIALGSPTYVGFKGIFLPHLLLYSTLTACVAALLWFTFVRARILPAPRLGRPTARQLGAGVVGGILALIATVVFVYVLFPPNTVHWIDPVPWKIAGNVFSNFYEEFVYRGFMLVAPRCRDRLLAGRDHHLRDVGLYAQPIPAFTAGAHHGGGRLFQLADAQGAVPVDTLCGAHGARYCGGQPDRLVHPRVRLVRLVTVGLLHWIVSSNGMWLEPRHGALLEDASGPEPQRISTTRTCGCSPLPTSPAAPTPPATAESLPAARRHPGWIAA